MNSKVLNINLIIFICHNFLNLPFFSFFFRSIDICNYGISILCNTVHLPSFSTNWKTALNFINTHPHCHNVLWFWMLLILLMFCKIFTTFVCIRNFSVYTTVSLNLMLCWSVSGCVWLHQINLHELHVLYLVLEWTVSCCWTEAESGTDT